MAQVKKNKLGERVQHWPLILSDLVLARQHTPFKWGTNDCCLWACDVIKACTSTDLAAKFRGRYSDATGATRIIKRFGKNLEKMVEKLAKQNRLEEVHPNMAQRLYLVMTDTADHGPSLGICIGSTGAFAGHNGLVFYPMSSCRRAWKV